MQEATYNKSILRTVLTYPGQLNPEEMERVRQSIAVNGMAVLSNYVDSTAASRIRHTAEVVCTRGYGAGAGVYMPPSILRHSMEFRHPYICSRDGVEFVTGEPILSLLENFLGKEPIIHHALFQVSLPTQEQSIDYHIDCGSVKVLNQDKKFEDFRLRTILYLTDVETGGFSYILNSASDALPTFFKLPSKELFPQSAVPQDPDRRITVNEPAGTVIIFNTHGLHRPEIPQARRIVLNTWFAQKDFSGKLPAILFSLGLVPSDRRHRLHIFENEKNCDLEQYLEPKSEPLPYLKRVLAAALKAPAKKSNYAYFE